MSDPAPTFSTNRDRVAYLLGEFRLPITIVLLAAGVWALWATPQIPSPPQWMLNASASAGLLAFPTFFLARKVCRWLWSPNFTTVGVAYPGEQVIYEKYNVPPDIWDEKTVDGPRPMAPDEGVDYVVTAFEWLEDVGELHVRGCERSDMTPDEALADAARVEEYYDHHHEVRRAFSRLKAHLQSKATEIQDMVIMTSIEEREKAELAPGVSVTELIEELESDAEEMPEAPAPADDLGFHPNEHAVGMGMGETSEQPAPGPRPTATDGGRDE